MNDVTLPDGTVVKTGCLQPDVLRFSSVAAWDEANPVLGESECEDHDDLAPFCKPVKYQKNNNCTNAALAGAMECLLQAAGEEGVPELSSTMLYALHNGGRDQGAYCRDLAADAKVRGLCRASLFPEGQIYVPRGGIPREALDDARNYALLEVYQCLNWQHVVSALARRFVVYHGFVLGQRFFDTRGDGKVPPYDGRWANGHAMWSRGLTRKFGDLRTVTPNSWSNSFGDRGVGYIDKSYWWDQSGNRVNLDCYAIRAVKKVSNLPLS